MMLALGIIIGLLIATLVILTVVFLRHPLEKNLRIVEQKVSSAGPQPRGMIIMPDSEAEELQQEIIEENRQHGRDTKLSELM